MNFTDLSRPLGWSAWDLVPEGQAAPRPPKLPDAHLHHEIRRGSAVTSRTESSGGPRTGSEGAVTLHWAFTTSMLGLSAKVPNNCYSDCLRR